MKFVENEEFQIFAVANDLLVEIVLPRQQQFEHHEVRKQDVRRVVGDPLPQLLTFLAGVTLIGNAMFDRDILEVPIQFADLAVRQRVHWIDHDGPGAGATIGGPSPQHGVDDRDEEAHRLAGTSSGGDDKALLVVRDMDGLDLVGAQLPIAKDHIAAWMQDPFANQVGDAPVAPVVRIDLDDRLRPISS